MKKIILSVLLLLVSASYTFAFVEDVKGKCESGDKEACFTFGAFFESDQDYQKALHYYTIACDANVAKACGRAANLYFKGMGARQDLRKAETLFLKGCNLGDEFFSCPALSSFYALTNRYQESKKYAERSCYNKVSPSAFGCAALGFLYLDGLGVEKNLSKAREYLQRACDWGFDFACDEVKKLDRR